MGLKTGYKVVAGKHANPDPKNPRKLKYYKKGQIVWSDKDLVKAFPNKFVEVNGEEDNFTSAARKKADEFRKRAREREEPDAEPEEENEEEGDAAEPASEEDIEDMVADEEEDVKESLGKDVTSKFEALEAKGLTVLFDGGNYNVLNDSDVLVTNLEDKRSVIDWFKEWTKTTKKKSKK